AVPADYTFVAGDQGVHVFPNGVTLVTAGSQTITATDPFIPGSASQASMVVGANTATRLVLTGTYPTPTTAGVAQNFTVMAKDPFGNIATGYLGTVALSSTDPQATFAPSAYLFTSTDAGVHTFSGTLKTVGTQTITVSDGTISGSQSGVSV